MDYRFFVVFVASILILSLIVFAQQPGPLAEATGNILTGEQQTGDVNVTANAATTTTTTTVAAAATTTTTVAGGGGGGGGGGVTVITTEETKIVTVIPAGGTGIITITKSDTLKVDLIEIEAKNEVRNGQVTVKESAKPAEANIVIQTDQGKVYKYLEITTTINKSDVSKVTVRFKVEKSWISGNNIDPNTIALNKLVGTSWSKLVTTKVSEDANNIFYEAEMSSLSIFAVTGMIKTGVTTTTLPGATTTLTLPGATTTLPGATTTTLPGIAPPDNTLLIIAAVAVILVVLALILRRRQQKFL